MTVLAPRPVHDIAETIYRYARRWAVGQSPNPEDAVIYDASLTLINELCAPDILSRNEPTAREDRYRRYGEETIGNAFTIPITVEDAITTLHRYARRYTNGRGSFTAAIVNEAAHDLLMLGLGLDETRRLDGTIWAADGTGGAHDGLTTAHRDEALSVLPQSHVRALEDFDYDVDATPVGTFTDPEQTAPEDVAPTEPLDPNFRYVVLNPA